MKTQSQLISYYQAKLEKVKNHYEAYVNGKLKTCTIDANEYIAFAEKQVEEVRNGRNW